MYREVYLPKIEADFPLTVLIGTSGQTKTFDKGEEQDFFDWLVEDPSAVYMWRGCMDILAVSNMLRMKVECIVYEAGSVPEVYNFSPDPEFPFLIEDKMKPKDPTELKYPKMTLLNYKNNHLNLIVEKDSMIAKLGSFCFQRQQEKIKHSELAQLSNERETKLYQRIESLEKHLKDTLDENQKLKEQIITIHKTYDVHQNKCEECGSIFCDTKQLENHTTIHNFVFSFNCHKCWEGFNNKNNFKYHENNHCEPKNSVCPHCKKVFIIKNQLTAHTQNEHSNIKLHICKYCNKHFQDEESLKDHEDATHQFNCLECDHQTHNESALRKHIDIAHKASVSEKPEGMGFKCATCAQCFEKKDSLMNHRRYTHGKSKTKCKYNIPPSVCKKGERECAFDHNPALSKPNEFTCTACKEMFPTKSQVLNHRKTNHPEKVPMCRSIKEELICQFSPCRYNHEQPILDIIPPTHVNQNASISSETKSAKEPNFWMAPKTLNPGEQMQKLMSMIQTMTIDISLLKENHSKKN